MNDLKTIRQLIKLMVDNDLTEIDLEGEGEKIKLKRGAPPGSFASGGVQYLPAPQAPAYAPQAAQKSSGSGGHAEADDDEVEDGLLTIDSPMVGTFYAASNPDSPALAKKGDAIKPDTVVCIIEAMKVFNEIKAEAGGTIVEVLVTNGQSVEFGQPMFKVRP